ncbi:uncharacterized protein Z518_05743 [Rhinocladiella mackenziei CBS 650.93]|uniref:37S ribosomal protein Rsm22 n=1 Tax=Rhinocladiella mackenziei CBS 650.93 TaxID=1442369 RepID=A0A0D2FRT2_9EURO|nr:uncharacterized protein Z518_05743 [Rhinocladiella mackenziei CBS 650.93]KIX04872.1 hypothetical protein Z518_05743 [Rhinocladiella mackenziei CBS 650.93]
MLSWARASGLCHGCRQDLQNIFERGFCGPVVNLKTRTAPCQWRRTVKSRQQFRSYTRSSIAFERPPPPEYQGRDTPYEIEPVSEADTIQDQLEALQELEKALGRSIEEAIEQDQVLGKESNDFDPDEELSLENNYENIVRGTKNVLADLRALGVSEEELVRKARKLYGDRLPAGVLNEDEFKIYRRLYGDPISTAYEEFLDEEEATDVDEEVPNQLLTQEGEPVDLEEVSEAVAENEDVLGDTRSNMQRPTPAHGDIGIDFGPRDSISALLSSPVDRAIEVARTVDGEVVEDVDQEDSSMKRHPFTTLGKFSTKPSTVFLSQDGYMRPVQKIMSNFSNKHLKDVCEKTFGGPGLPDSPLTPRSGRARPQIPIPLDASQHIMGEMEANAFITTVMPPTYAAIMSVLVETRKRLGTTWLNKLFAEEGGPRILDVGAGGAGILAWREIVKAHWDTLHSSDRHPPSPPTSKSVVLTGSNTLRRRAAALLENTTFIPRLPDYVHTRDTPTLEDDRPAPPRKQFDVIIASHSLFGLHEDWMRKQHVQNLWSMLSPQGGVLILIEKGVPRGFEAIAGARELILERYIAIPEGRTTGYSTTHENEDIHTRETGMIVAPCTNHEKCPMYKVPGLSVGRKDYCSFQQRYTRPGYLQRVLGAKDRNHDDVDFSYISVMRGEDLRQRQVESWQGLEDGLSAPVHPDLQVLGQDYDAWASLCQTGFDDINPDTTLSQSLSDDMPRSTLPAPWNLPRLVFTPIKRRGHVILDVCTPAGQIERWTVPKSFGKQAYRDARKSQWGDLWALGAKTRIPRSLRLGGPNTKEARHARSREERLKNQAAEMAEQMEMEKLEELEEERELERAFGMDDHNFADELEALGKKAQEVSKSKYKPPTKVKPRTNENSAASSGGGAGIQSFTFSDFDESKLNPMPPSKAKAQARMEARQSAQPSKKANTRSHSAFEAEASGYEGLTDEESDTLRDWEDVLTDPETKIKTKGGRTIREYSKFGARDRLGRMKKVGKVPRVGRRRARGRSGL